MDFIPSCVFLARWSDMGVFLDFGKTWHLPLVDEVLLFLGGYGGFLGRT